jgi:hypothetical protein
MKTIRIGSAAYALAIIASVSVTPSQAQPAAPPAQTALAKEAGTRSDKFTGPARVLAGKYVWKPVNSVYTHDWNEAESALPFAPANIACLALPEIPAGKIRACYQGNKARDI